MKKLNAFTLIILPYFGFAQSPYDNRNNYTDPTQNIIFYIIGLIVTIYITRSIFSISGFIKYQKAQINLLSKIARTHGVKESEIQGILNAVNLKEYKSKE